MPRVPRTALATALLGASALVTPVAAQQVGDAPPDVSFVTATAAGPGKRTTLADYKGQTVVLAFFFKARTPG